MKTKSTRKIQLIKEQLRSIVLYHVKLDGETVHSTDDFTEATISYEKTRDEAATRSRFRVLLEEEL